MNIEDRAIEHERKYGEVAFVKICTSALNQLLVKKGLITKEELVGSLEEQLDEVEANETTH